MKKILKLIKSYVPIPIKRSYQITKFGFRYITAPFRIMPDFIIIGAAKCGTTSLYNYLVQHPCIAPAHRKQVFYFATNRHSKNWYKAFFPTIFKKVYHNLILRMPKITGEATPYYILHPLCPQRIKHTLPDVKIIVLLRNPTDRAYSHYQHVVRVCRENLTFEEAIDKENERIHGELEKLINDENYLSKNFQDAYLLGGLYADQLEQWLKLFSQQQILILKSEDLYRFPQKIYKQVIDFLNLPGFDLKQFKVYNSGDYKPYPKMQPKTRERLIEYFRPYNKRLYNMLGANFEWDK